MSGGYSSASTSQMPSGCSRMIVSLSSSVIGSMMVLFSIKCLDVVCLFARLLKNIGQPTLLSRELGITIQEIALILRLREKVRRVPWLRNLRHQHITPHEQVFVLE